MVPMEPRMLENVLDLSGDIQRIIRIETETSDMHRLNPPETLFQN